MDSEAARLVALLLVMTLQHIVVSQEVRSILVEERNGCLAKLDTDAGIKWVNLQDDRKLIGDKQYLSKGAGGRSYLWRPCELFDITLPKDVHINDNTCQQTYVAWKNNERSCTSLGEEGRFELVDKQLQINYTTPDSALMKATVLLVCNETLDTGQLTCEERCGSYQPVLKYESSYVCLRNTAASKLAIFHDADRLSVGSYILIVASFIFSVYIITGLIRGSIKGRSGCDRLPNSDFWFELPLLVRDGCCLVCCCKLPFIYLKRHRKGEICQPIMYDQTTPVVDL